MFTVSENPDCKQNLECSEGSRDLHICGTCKSQFSHIDEFVIHKKQGCGGKKISELPKLVDESSLPVVSGQPPHVLSCPPPTLQPSRSSSPSTREATHSSDILIRIDKLTSLTASHPTGRNTASSVKISTSNCATTSQSNKRFKCHYDGCLYSSAYPKDLQRHLRVHTGERPFECKLCGKKFNRSDKYKVHERYHSGIKPYKCKECSYATGDSSSLKKHLRIHSDERPFRCQICQYASRNSSQLVVHLRTHTGDAPFQCPMCPNKFKINSDLKRHLRLHTGEKPYTCSFCDYKCSIKGNLKTHIRLIHSTDNLQKCSHCDFSSPSRKALRQHETSHLTKTIKCPFPQCEYSCKSRSLLRNHSRTHSDERPFKCKHCPYTSRQPGNVRTHLKKRHPEKLTVKIRKVGADSKKNAPNDAVSDVAVTGTVAVVEQSKNHVVSKESRPNSNSCEMRGGRNRPMCVRSFKCHLCASAFVRVDSLRSHLRQHRELHIASQSTLISISSTSDSNSSPSEASDDSDIVSSDSVTTQITEDLEIAATTTITTVSASSDPTLNSIEPTCSENMNDQQPSEDDTCVLNVYHQPLLTSQEGENVSDQVIEQALRQSGVLCLPSGSLDCGATLNLVHGDSTGAIEVETEQAQGSNFFMTNDDGSNSQAVLNAITSLGSSSDVGVQTIQASLSPSVDLSDGKTVLMNTTTTNIEIPLSALAASGIGGEPAQLIYQMQPSIRLVPYRSPATIQYVLKTTPTGCTQILFNSATSETGEPLQLHDVSILQSHVDSSSPTSSSSSPRQVVDNSFNQQLVNYVVNNGLDSSSNTALVANVGDTTVSRYLLVSTPVQQTTGALAAVASVPSVPTTTTTATLNNS